MEEPLTEEMLAELLDAGKVESYLQQHDLSTPSLGSYLRQQLEERNLKRVDVLKRANIGETFGWYIFNDQRGAGRDTVLKLAFAMGMDVRCANRALQAAGANALYPKKRRDAIIIYCLEHGCTLQQVNDALYDFGEECL